MAIKHVAELCEAADEQVTVQRSSSIKYKFVSLPVARVLFLGWQLPETRLLFDKGWPSALLFASCNSSRRTVRQVEPSHRAGNSLNTSCSSLAAALSSSRSPSSSGQTLKVVTRADKRGTRSSFSQLMCVYENTRERERERERDLKNLGKDLVSTCRSWSASHETLVPVC